MEAAKVIGAANHGSCNSHGSCTSDGSCKTHGRWKSDGSCKSHGSCESHRGCKRDGSCISHGTCKRWGDTLQWRLLGPRMSTCGVTSPMGAQREGFIKTRAAPDVVLETDTWDWGSSDLERKVCPVSRQTNRRIFVDEVTNSKLAKYRPTLPGQSAMVIPCFGPGQGGSPLPNAFRVRSPC